MSQATLPSAVPGSIVRKLHLVRSWKRWVHLATAVLLALVVLLAAMGVAMLVDWLSTLYDSRWRYVLTNTALVAAALTSLGWLLVMWRRGLAWSRVAGDVDREFPELEERWTTMTRLAPAAAGDAQLVHPAMLRRVASEAVRWEPHVDPQQIVSLSPLIRTMLCLTALTLVLAVAVILDARQTLVLVRRFWSPGTLISATELVNVPGNTVVGRGEPLLLEANIDGKPVDRATLFLNTGNNDERKITLVAHGKDPISFSHNVRSVDEAFAYRFRAGDGQTEWYQVDVADRPEIEKLRMTVTPPAYTKREAKTFDRLPRRMTVIAGSELVLSLRPKIPVERVELRAGNKQVAVLSASEDGWYRWQTQLKKDVSFAPLLTESHGLVNRQSPRCEIQVVADKPPAVKILTPDDQVAVRPNDTIDITFAAQDDVGIGSAELVVYGRNDENGQPTPLKTIQIPLGEQAGERTVQGQVELDLSQFKVSDGGELSYQVRVREDRGPLEEGNTSPDATGAAAPPDTSMAQASQAKSSPEQPSAERTAANDSPAKETSANAPSAEQTAAAKGAGERVGERVGENAKPQAAETAQAAEGVASKDGAAGRPKTAEPKPQDVAQQGAAKSSASPSPNTTTPNMPTPPGIMPSIGLPIPKLPMPGMPGGEKLASMEKKSATPTGEAKSQPGAGKSQPGRMAESDRRGLMSGAPENAPKEPESAKGEPAGASQMAKNDSSQKGNSQPSQPQPSASAASKPSPGGNQSASKGGASKPSAGQPAPGQTAGEKKPSSGGDPPPGDLMPKRMLDVAQASTSQRMRLKVDQWAGSFSGQQRQKLELSIGPKLAALDETLAKAERTAQGVLDVMAAGEEWRATHDRDVSSAEQATENGQKIIGDLEKQTKETPYAFIGLQVVDVGLAHVEPARSGFWTALQADGDSRVGNVRDAQQHLVRARQLVAELRGQFERSKREFQLAESVDRVKKMYQVFVENSMALLPTSPDEGARYKRKMAEFELSDEYLKRLQEVVKMREELRAELARILADDPRLLRRLMDSIRNRSENLRNELSELVADQKEFNREVRAWSETEEADRPRIAQLLLMRQLRKSMAIATSTGELQDRYQAWLPLNRKSQEGSLTAATKKVQDLAAGASQLAAHSQQYILDATAPKLAEAEVAKTQADDGAGGEVAKPQAEVGLGNVPTVESMVAEGQSLYELAVQAETTLQQLSASEADAEVAAFAANRLIDARKIIASTSAWVRQVRAHQADKYSRAAEVEQYRLAMKTEELAGKLGSIEQTLAGLMQREDGSLPEPIAVKAREFMATLDNEASPNQLAAVYALHVDDMPRATERQVLAGGALDKAEQLYDEMVKLAIAELDKLPVQDPVSQLLEDPTLDELLAQLEQEQTIDQLLGIPPRPSNLRIVNDWLRPNGQLSTAMRSRAFMQQQMNRQNQQMRQQLDQAYRRAVARALKESTSRTKIALPKRTKLSDWNRLVSELKDDVGQGRDKAPPEQYRRAIEQYFAQISKEVAEEEKAQ